MRQAIEHKWGFVIHGVDRSELSDAFRGSQWEDSWYDMMSPLEADDPDAGLVVSLQIPDLDTLIAAIKCVGHLQPTYGISLYGSAGFGAIRAEYNLCTKDSGFVVSNCTLHRTTKSFGTEIEARLKEAEKALGEMRMLLADSEGSAE